MKKVAIMPRPGSTAGRGYGHEHQRLRSRLLPLAYGTKCWRCGKTMYPGQSLDLGHTDDRTGYTGMEHATCNRAAGSRKAHGTKKPTINVRDV